MRSGEEPCEIRFGALARIQVLAAPRGSSMTVYLPSTLGVEMCDGAAVQSAVPGGSFPKASQGRRAQQGEPSIRSGDSTGETQERDLWGEILAPAGTLPRDPTGNTSQHGETRARDPGGAPETGAESPKETGVTQPEIVIEDSLQRDRGTEGPARGRGSQSDERERQRGGEFPRSEGGFGEASVALRGGLRLAREVRARRSMHPRCLQCEIGFIGSFFGFGRIYGVEAFRGVVFASLNQCRTFARLPHC